MKYREIELESKVDGMKVTAQLTVCPECNETEFLVIIIGKDHVHLQCVHCDEMFCDNSCFGAGREN